MSFWQSLEVITFVITASGALFGVITYLVHLRRWHRKKADLIAYLRDAKSDGDRGQRSALNITRALGLSEVEILNFSYWSPLIKRRVKTDAANFAEILLFEYGGDDA